jgi:hypothetical protein
LRSFGLDGLQRAFISISRLNILSDGDKWQTEFGVKDYFHLPRSSSHDAFVDRQSYKNVSIQREAEAAMFRATRAC